MLLQIWVSDGTGSVTPWKGTFDDYKRTLLAAGNTAGPR